MSHDPYDSLVPVFLQTDAPKRVSQLGTAVFVELYGMPFLLTAAHVSDDGTVGNLLVPAGDVLRPIEGYWGWIDPMDGRREDHVDVAYIRPSTEFALALSRNFKPMPQTRIRILGSASELGACSVCGYPASKGKKRDGAFESEIFSFRGGAAPVSAYAALGLMPDTNVVIEFHKKRAVHPETLASVSVPGLRGVSGGAIFAWPRGHELSCDWSHPELVGIMHTYKEREGLIIGTNVVPILAAVGLGMMKGFGGVS